MLCLEECPLNARPSHVVSCVSKSCWMFTFFKVTNGRIYLKNQFLILHIILSIQLKVKIKNAIANLTTFINGKIFVHFIKISYSNIFFTWKIYFKEFHVVKFKRCIYYLLMNKHNMWILNHADEVKNNGE